MQGQIGRYGTAFLPVPELPKELEIVEAQPVETGKATSMLDVIVDKLHGQGAPAHQVWLPPLAEPPGLTDLLGELTVDERRGLVAAGWPGVGQLVAPVGVVDRPFEQRRDPFVVELDGAGGNVVIVGGPQSGKSTMLRSLICSFALTHTPSEVQFFCLDFGGGAHARPGRTAPRLRRGRPTGHRGGPAHRRRGGGADRRAGDPLHRDGYRRGLGLPPAPGDRRDHR